MTITQSAFLAKSWNPVEVWFRPFIAIAAITHYIIKILLPINQAIIYPLWNLSLTNTRYLSSIIFILTLFFLIWRYRKTLPDMFFWGLALFLVTVSPMLGFIHFTWMEFAFVSDHYVYLGSPGVILMVVLAFEVIQKKWLYKSAVSSHLASDKSRKLRFNIFIISLICIATAAFSFRIVQQNKTWKNNFTLWTYTLTINPDCMIAHLNLGNHYMRNGDYKAAMSHYYEAARIDPDYAIAYRNVAICLQNLNRKDEAVSWYKAAVETVNRKSPQSWSLHTEYADYLLQLGRKKDALAEYELILKKNPPNAEKIKQTIRMVQSQIHSTLSN
jgi:hypothetical protein